MTKETLCEAERRRLEKMNKFQLPHAYKRIGYLISAMAFLLMIAKIFFEEPSWVKPLLSNILLFGLLMASISRDKDEDEMIVNLRSQSYRLAFILGVLYSFVQPYVNYYVALLIRPENASKDFSYFQVLAFMLLIQLMFFHQLKKLN